MICPYHNLPTKTDIILLIAFAVNLLGVSFSLCEEDAGVEGGKGHCYCHKGGEWVRHDYVEGGVVYLSEQHHFLPTLSLEDEVLDGPALRLPAEVQHEHLLLLVVHRLPIAVFVNLVAVLRMLVELAERDFILIHDHLGEVEVVPVLWLTDIHLELPWTVYGGLGEEDGGEHLTWDAVAALSVAGVQTLSKKIQHVSEETALQLAQVVGGVLSEVVAIGGEDEGGDWFGGHPFGCKQCGVFPCEPEVKLGPEGVEAPLVTLQQHLEGSVRGDWLTHPLPSLRHVALQLITPNHHCPHLLLILSHQFPLFLLLSLLLG